MPYYDYRKGEWCEVKNACKTVKLKPIVATINKDAKILLINSFRIMYDLIKKYDNYYDEEECIIKILRIAKKQGYDIVNIRNDMNYTFNDYSKSHENDILLEGDDVIIDKFEDWDCEGYYDFSRGGGNDDYFIINKKTIKLQKEIKNEKINR